MRQLVYVSAASWKLSQDEIDAILAAARRENPAHGVTGMLLYADLGFLQVLEGPKDGVEFIYQRILGDKRHRAQRILVDQDANERLFAQWSMGFDRPDPRRAKDSDIFALTREAIHASVPLEKAAIIAVLLRNFYTVNRPNNAE